jgi:hypothetical protein
MFNNKSLPYLLLGFCVVMVASYAGNQIKKKFADTEAVDEYSLVKKYLLNDSAMYGKNRPKLWIHSKYEVNARKWKNFMSRNSTDLNQPYLYLTIQSVINHCGDDFHICLVDDESFEKLIPSWTIDLSQTPEPMRSHYRDIGMTQLLYIYGGIRVPNSFLCTKSLIEIYKQGCANKQPFIAEKRNLTTQGGLYVPDIQFMGAKKEDSKLEDMIQIMNRMYSGHFQHQTEFKGAMEEWCKTQIENHEMQLVDGKLIGIKTAVGKPILLEDLMSSDFLDMDTTLLHGIYIPSQELLRRPKYQYYAILPTEDVLEADNILSKYFKMSMVDGVDEYYKKRNHQSSSIIAI